MAEPATVPADGPLRLLQVGAGGMGRAWLATIADNPDVELVGLVDLDLETAREAAAGAGVPDLPVGRALAELAGPTRAQAVVDVTVPRAHHAVNTEALLAGLPVLCEKPLAESLAECLSMVAVSELTGQLLMVSQSRRYWRHLDRLRSQLVELGPVGLATCTFARGPHFGGFRDAMPHPLLVDMAIHQFDLARDLVGSEPVEAFCASSNPPWSWYAGDAAATAVFRFADGARFTFDGSWCSPGLETSWNGHWRLATAEGSAVWDGDGAPLAERADGTPVPGTASDAPEQIAGSLAEFVRVLRHGGTPSGEVHRNVLSVAMVDAATASAEQGRWVRIADLLEQAHGQAVADERRPEVRAVLESWPSAAARVGLPAAAP
ncbi:Predicted dehydrogenase [Friedmanniella luteola]|uniref:Predicted dehydrogenase n=1 Tax=Friedmanniella luteola TaxID=546871 RepID=A0A1H1QK42_9ACTN|nr:Gfo/Idh/MocA family oxidoreductase [Friedmanniella luteola]SDS23279.1 Predicted dehydrogenase [Friedmanniella luteola]